MCIRDSDNVSLIETITLGSAVTSVVTKTTLVESGATLTVSGGSTTSLTWDGSAETDGGKFNITGGVGNDTLTGGSGDDTISGGAGVM